jgi:hypothetical protein
LKNRFSIELSSVAHAPQRPRVSPQLRRKYEESVPQLG